MEGERGDGVGRGVGYDRPLLPSPVGDLQVKSFISLGEVAAFKLVWYVGRPVTDLLGEQVIFSIETTSLHHFMLCFVDGWSECSIDQTLL